METQTVKLSSAKDKSVKGWIIVMACFMSNFLIFGIHNCFGLISEQLKSELSQSDGQNVVAKISFVGSLSIGMTFLMSPVAGILIDLVGAKKTAMLGGMMAVSGMVTSAYALNKIEILFLTYGILFGGGASLVYSPAVVVLGHYFDRYLGLVNGILATGSSVATVVLPFILEPLFSSLGLAQTFQVTAGMLFILVLCSLFYDIPKSEESKPIFNREVWKNRRYIIWVIGIPISMLGYFVPYTHLVAFSRQIAPDSDAKLLMTCIGFMSGIGRLIFGKMADHPKVNRLLLQQIAMVFMGLSMMCMSFAASFSWLIVTSLSLGLFDGCFICLFGTLAFDICGPHGATQGIGFLLGLKAIPVMIGPPIAGHIYSALNNSYVTAFLVAGIPSLFGAAILTFAHIKKEQQFDLEQPKSWNIGIPSLGTIDDVKKPSSEFPVILKSVVRTASTVPRSLVRTLSNPFPKIHDS
ncbi:monocarboxylate transporter 10-like [Artemia franciscana]|uniref:Monocarboxylate transporter 10 n=1 Tax=Artemia franciscana TaxID=6661 RepID=A0AA88HJX0_ARTSF|nr:hypothetical protein QYM36_012043 [Artemia franciscana]